MVYSTLMLISEYQSFFQWAFGIAFTLVTMLVGFAIRTIRKEIDEVKQETSLMQTRLNTLEINIMEKLSSIEKSITRLETLSEKDRPALQCQTWMRDLLKEKVKGA